MIERQAIAVVRSALLAGFAARAMPTVQVIQNYQPTRQGRPSTPTILLHRIADTLVGTPGYRVRRPGDAVVTDETTIHRVAIQFNAVCEETTDASSLTANDYLTIAAQILRNYDTVRAMVAAGVSVENVTAIRSMPALSDTDTYDPNPSFDLTITYPEVRTTTTATAALSGTIIKGI